MAREARAQAVTGGATNSLADLDLQDFIPALTPRWQSPRHLSPLTNVFERIKRGESVRVLLSVPPQHGKTETELHGIAQLLLLHPERTNAFASYGGALSLSKSSLLRDYAIRAGVRMSASVNSKSEWRTREGGGLLATSVDGAFSGQAVDGVLVIDDPHKNRQEAESACERQRVEDFYTSTAMTRVHPSTSVIIVHTRWHEDDLIGRRIKDRKPDGKGGSVPVWEVINLPALNERNEPLWPDQRPLELLEAARLRSEYDWWSMYMGSPRPKGGALFQDVNFFTSLPKTFRICIGVDLAYTAKTHSDYSVAVVMAESGGKYYILDVVRVQVAAPDFGTRLKALAASFPGAPMRAYVSGTEKGAVDYMRKDGVPLRGKAATADKFVRAQAFAAAWNQNLVFVPINLGALARDGVDAVPEDMRGQAPEWVGPYVTELKDFTGIDDAQDDQVDASAPAYDKLRRIKGVGGQPATAALPAVTSYASPLA